MSKRAPILLASEEGILGAKDGREERVLARFELTDDTYEFLDARFASGADGGESARDVDLGYYVRSGSLSVTVGETTHSLASGDFLHVRAGSTVSLASDPNVETQVLVIQVPAAREGEASLRVTTSEGRCVGVVGDLYRFLTEGEHTGGRYSLFEAIVTPGGGPPPHVHSREEELFFVLEGVVSFLIDGVWRDLGPGSFANMPSGFPHTFHNRTERHARMLIGVAPAGLERMFLEVGVPLTSRDADIPPPSPELVGKLIGAVARFGVELLIPKP